MVRVAHVFVTVMLVFLSFGCATGGGQTVKIDLRDVEGLQSMPKTVTNMLRDLGYDWIPVAAPDTPFGVKMAQQDNEYRMRFEYLETRQVRIDVRIGRLNRITRLRLYELDSLSLSPSSKALLQQLQRRTKQEFGEVNVSY